jgi:hypothetical protein
MPGAGRASASAPAATPVRASAHASAPAHAATSPRASTSVPAWSVSVISVGYPAAVALPQEQLPALRGRVARLLMVEGEPEVLSLAYLYRVRVRNVSKANQTLRWDIAHCAHLRLGRDTLIASVGQKLLGLADSSVAVGGSLEVVIPPKASYDLYPVFTVRPRGATLVLDRIGESPVPAESTLHAPTAHPEHRSISDREP